MEKQNLIEMTKQAFFGMCDVSEDSCASDEFIRTHHCGRIDDGVFRLNKFHEQQMNGMEEEEEHAFAPGVELDIYRFPVASPAGIQDLIKEIAKTFPDLEGKSYVFLEYENANKALSEWGSGFGNLGRDGSIVPADAFLALKVYGDKSTALYLVFGPSCVLAFVFGLSMNVVDEEVECFE